MKTVRQNLSKALLVGLFMFSLIMIALQGSSAAMVAVAAETGNVYAYDNTDVMDDLNGSDGFDIKDYPANANGVYEIFTFLEYGYSKNWTQYGLYLYVYNPQQKEISRSSASNKANVAVAYNDDGDASSYQRFEMKFCSASADGLFYKFRILDPSNVILDTARKYAANNGGTRRYYIADVELFAYGETLATATKIGKRYDCTGYMKGFGDDKNVNTFDCVAHSYDVLDIELKHTFFRPEGTNYSNFATEYCMQTSKDQLDSVYFSISNDIIEYYGGIWKIVAGYYAYRTRPIVITSLKSAWEQFDLWKMQSKVPMQSVAEKIWQDKINGSDAYKDVMIDFLLGQYTGSSRPYYFFYTGNETSDGSVPYAKDFSLSGDRLLEYIYNYNASYDTGKLNIKDGTISNDLFWTCPELEAKGYGQYKNIEITADKTYTLENLSKISHWYDFLDYFHLGTEYQSDAYRDIQAIVPIEKSDITLSRDAFCKKYFISDGDYDDIIESVKSKNETTYLFRFAQSDFISMGLETKPLAGNVVYNTDYAYEAMQTVYLDMNISSITCKKGDVYHTFAVCSNPLDAASDVEPPIDYDQTEWWKELAERLKNWWDDNKTAIIITIVVIVCVAIVIMIVVISVKTAPYSAMRAMAKAQSPPKKRQPQKRKTPNKNAAQKTRAGRSKKK